MAEPFYKLQEYRRDRSAAVTAARALFDAAEAETRDLTDEEQTQWEAHMDSADGLRQRIEREERQLEAERQIERRNERREQDDPNEDVPEEERSGRNSAEYRSAFEAHLRSPNGASNEQRAVLHAENDEAGGFLLGPGAMSNEMIQLVDDAVYIRQWASVFPVDDLGVVELTKDVDDAEWTTELQTGSDSDVKFGKRRIKTNPYAKRVKLSRTLMRRAPNVIDIVNDRLAVKFGVTEEKGFMLGNGAGQPLGVFTPSDSGIPTSRDVSEDNTTTKVTGDGLISAKFSLKTQYWNSARWMFHRNVVKQLAKLKDNDGQYLWRESIRAGEPDRLLGRPVFMSEFCPHAIAPRAYVGVLGDFSHYWIADPLTLQIQMLWELYAENNQVGVIGRKEGDGAPVKPEAFARVQLGAA